MVRNRPPNTVDLHFIYLISLTKTGEVCDLAPTQYRISVRPSRESIRQHVQKVTDLRMLQRQGNAEKVEVLTRLKWVKQRAE